ncbi:hypothetical protein [Homoserinimonas sp. A520]
MSSTEPIGAGMTTAEGERLSLIRYQLLNAAELVKQPSPINTLAINAMQDVVESALGAVGEHVRADVKAKSDFDKLFDAVVAKLGSPNELTGLRSAAIALNNARVGFKHHGNQVRDETLRRHQDVAVTIVYELVRHGFGTELDLVSMLVFIPNEDARGFIEMAESLHKASDLTGAMTYLRSAFDVVVDDYANRKSVDGWKTIFNVEPRASHFHSVENWGWEKPLDELTSWVKSLDERLRLASIGVDLSRYAYFDAVAPVHTDMSHAGRGPHVRVRFEDLTDDHYRASYHFVVDTAIRLSSADFNLSPLRSDARSAETYDPEYRSAEYLRSQEKNARLLAERERRDNESRAAYSDDDTTKPDM